MSNTIWYRRWGGIGDVLMSLNSIPAVRKANPNSLIIYQTSPWIKELMGSLMLGLGIDAVVTQEKIADGPVIPLTGYPFHEGYPDKPMRKHLVEYYAETMGVVPDFNAIRLQTPEDPYPRHLYATIHTQAGWSNYKNWPISRWNEIKDRFQKLGLFVVQIGGVDDAQLCKADHYANNGDFNHNLATMAHSVIHCGPDSWTNHATNIIWSEKGKTSGVIVWGATQSSAAGYKHNHNLSTVPPCQPCFLDDERPDRPATRGLCRLPVLPQVDKLDHKCLLDLSVDVVWGAIQSQLAAIRLGKASSLQFEAPKWIPLIGNPNHDMKVGPCSCGAWHTEGEVL